MLQRRMYFHYKNYIFYINDTSITTYFVSRKSSIICKQFDYSKCKAEWDQKIAEL